MVACLLCFEIGLFFLAMKMYLRQEPGQSDRNPELLEVILVVFLMSFGIQAFGVAIETAEAMSSSLVVAMILWFLLKLAIRFGIVWLYPGTSFLGWYSPIVNQLGHRRILWPRGLRWLQYFI